MLASQARRRDSFSPGFSIEPMDPDRVTIVLHRPSSPENIGAAARVLMNFGFRRLALVAPQSWGGPGRRAGYPSARDDVLDRARRTARRAAALLDSAGVHPDARSALAGATWTCGTTSRRVEGRPRLGPRELAKEASRRAGGGAIAILFGEERRGLSDAELELCQAVCTIPTSADYDSMNLAQAVAIVAYELSLVGASEPGEAQPVEPPRHATVEALWDRVRALLASVGYLNPQNPDAILAEWRRLLARAEPTQREVELLAAAVRALERALRGAR